MSAGPGSALDAVRSDSVQIGHSAVLLGAARLGEGSLLAQGAVIRSSGAGVEVGTGSAVIENSVVSGTSEIPTVIGHRTTFGHRCFKQRSQFANGTDVDGFPAVGVGRIPEPPPKPSWALRPDALPVPAAGGPVR
jgi:acetyltransferase-like isoleucine patch superfamily enzyme